MAGSGAWIRVSGVAVTFGGAFLATYLVRKLLRKKEQRPKAKKALVCVTAFGKFNGVANNPTEVVLKELPAYLRANRLPQNVSVDRVKLLEVSADGSLEELQEQRQTAILGAEETRIWLHLGVDSGAKGFKLERSAWNEAAFRVPDERGWQPASQPISERHGSTSTCLRTRLPTSRLCAALRKQGFEVAVSDDPGRFVCNWIFFNSLCACREKDDTEEELGRGDETAMFLHVPAFTSADKDKQLRLVHSVLCAIGLEVCAA